MTSTSQTLADRVASGRIPVGEAVRIGMQLAEQLRQLHDQGTAHGEVTPWAVAIYGASLELLPPAGIGVTAYAAPEVAAGGPADARSDIFSFGAIFYEMVTGRVAFDGTSASPRPSGSPAIDRVVNACVAESPDSRFQRVQKLILELRLLASAARRGAAAPVAAPAVAPLVERAAAPAFVRPVSAAAPVASTPPPPPTVFHQMQELENRIGARLAEQERAIASVAQVANEVLAALRQQQVAAAPPPAPAPRPAARPSPAPRLHTRTYTPEPLDDYSDGRVDQVVAAIGDRLARLDLVVSSAVERLQKLEEQLDAFDTDAAALRDSVTRDVRNFERALKAQSTAIESARTAMGQTDDLVERVVEALDSLQSMFVNTGEEHSLAS
jgi:eukaryotic-like serine/threonine-protein kinase